MTKQIRLSALALAGALGLTLMAPGAAHAGSKGKQNTALALGAVAAYGLVTKKPLVAGVAGAGALYSYAQSRRDASDERDDWRRRGNYRDYDRYDRGGRYDDYNYGRNSRYDDYGYGGRNSRYDDYGYGGRGGRYSSDYGYGGRGNCDSRGSRRGRR